MQLYVRLSVCIWYNLFCSYNRKLRCPTTSRAGRCDDEPQNLRTRNSQFVTLDQTTHIFMHVALCSILARGPLIISHYFFTEGTTNPSPSQKIITERLVKKMPGGRSQANMTCFNCNDRGHISAECPKPRSQGECFICGQMGHKKR